jgi:putative phosphoribosyl transferase
MPKLQERVEQELEIPIANFHLRGELRVPLNASGVVLFAHGSGSGRHSPRNQYVARVLRDHGVGILLFDLLTEAEEHEDYFTRHLRFDISLLAKRLLRVTEWVHENDPEVELGYFGASTGAAAALVAESQSTTPIRAIVSRGGRPDLAGPALPRVKAPTLLIVGGEDHEVIRLNQLAFDQLNCEKELRIIPGAGHLFEESGTLEKAALLAADWFARHFENPKI